MQIITTLRDTKLGLGKDGQVIAPAGFVSGLHGSQFYHPSPTMCSLYDDFNGDSVDAQWDAKTGSNGSVVTPTVNSQASGVVRLTTGAGTSSMAVNGVQLHRFLTWKASPGHLAMECRLNLSAITNMAVFVGFTDQVASLEMPINSASSADTITTTATDAAGFMFDTAMTTTKWWLTGVANDTDGTHISSGTAPVAATFQVLRVQLDTAGNATYWINGTQVGQVALAVTPTVLLTPFVGGFTRTTAAQNIDVDYIFTNMTRV